MSNTVGEAMPERDTSRSLPSRLALFYRQVVAEMRKVIWPTRRELITYTWVVIVFVTVLAVIVGIFDVIFAKVVLQVFGN